MYYEATNHFGLTISIPSVTFNLRQCAVKTITDEQASYAMQYGEFALEVVASKLNVAIVLTQDWCPQWVAMKYWLYKMEESKSLDVYEFVYSNSKLFESFMCFKETKWKNDLIPYVRYYAKGKMIATSNYVSKQLFLEYFKEAE